MAWPLHRKAVYVCKDDANVRIACVSRHFYKGKAAGGFIWFCFLHLPEEKSVDSMSDRSCQGQLRNKELELRS
eukprot:s1255_g17.t1